MNILGMGPMEILLIVVLALIVFGPAKLPEIMGQVGKAIADFRRATSELSDEFNRTIQAELSETRALVDDTRSTVTGVQSSINSALTGATVPVLTTPATSVTVASPNGSGVTVPNGTTLEAPANGTNGSNGTNGFASATPVTNTAASWSWETAAPPPPKTAVEAAAPAPTDSSSASSPSPAAASDSPPAAAPRTRKSNVKNDILPPY